MIMNRVPPVLAGGGQDPVMMAPGSPDTGTGVVDVGLMPVPNYRKRGGLSLFSVRSCTEVPTDIYTLDLYC